MPVDDKARSMSASSRLSCASRLLRWSLRIVPGALQAPAGALLFNHLARGQPLAARLREIDGRSVAIDVTDLRRTLCFRIDGGRLRAVEARAPDVVIRGDVEGFLRLATRREDPDALFFQRRLCIEGDTEVGVHVKNLLDAQEFDWEAHLRAVLPAPLAERAVRGLHRARAAIAVR